jgi:KaiC/GvpD/RAD55 family RecA-like ATPase
VVEAYRVLGIPEVDEPLWTALPPGWLALLTGDSGSGAPLLAKQFAHAGAGAAPVLFYTTYERTEEVRKAFSDFGWDPDDLKIVNLADEYYERVLMRGLETARARETGLTLEQMVARRPDREDLVTFSLTDRMLSDLAMIDSPFRLVIDSIDFFFEALSPHEVTTVARQIRHRCQTIGGQALMAVHTPAHDRASFGLHDLADVVFELTAEPRGGGYEHTLFLQKVANRPDLNHIWRAEMGQDGWHVEERTTAPG